MTATGPKNLKFYERDRRRCQGDKLGQRSFTLDPAEDLTIVVTKKAPKVVVFDNAGLGEYPASRDAVDERAARLSQRRRPRRGHRGTRFWSGPPIEANPGTLRPLPEGTGERLERATGNNIFQVQATLGGGAKAISAPLLHVLSSHRYEWIVVGTKLANARIVFLDRLTSQPSKVRSGGDSRAAADTSLRSVARPHGPHPTR